MQRLLAFLFVFSLLQSSGLATLASAGEPAFHIASFVIEPTAPRAGDTVIVHLTVVDARDRPVTGLTGHAQVRPVVNAVVEDTVAEVVGLAETGPGEYVVTVPLNIPGEWRIVVTLTDAVRTLEQAARIVVAPRLDPPPPSQAPLVFRGSSWVTALRVDPATGSIVRLLGDSAVTTAETTLLVRRATSPLGPISRLFGGQWQLDLTFTDTRTGHELRVPLGPIRASLQPGSSSTPAIVVATTGLPTQPAVIVYQAWRLGEGWQSELVLVDTRSGDIVATTILPGALRGTQLLPRVAATPEGTIVVLERALSLQATGEARVTTLATTPLIIQATRRWSFSTTGLPDADCLANPALDGGVLGRVSPRWFAWCRDLSGTWLGLWDLPSGMLLARLPLDPTATVLLPSPDGSELFLVETTQRRLLALDAEVGRVRESTRSLRDTSTRPLRDELARFLAPPARAASFAELRAALSPDGRLLYAVFPTTTDTGDGLWIFATATLQLVDRLLLGWLVHGVVTAPDGTLIAVTDGPTGDRLVVLENDQPRLIVTVPERITEQLK